jgi:hypothetical protein
MPTAQVSPCENDVVWLVSLQVALLPVPNAQVIAVADPFL